MATTHSSRTHNLQRLAEMHPSPVSPRSISVESVASSARAPLAFTPGAPVVGDDGSNFEESGSDERVCVRAPTPQVELRSWQVDAVTKGTATLLSGKGYFLYGTMGCGKTLVALRTAQALAGALPSKDPFIVALVVPKCVEKQWCREMARSNIDEGEICQYAGKTRERLFAAWHAHAVAHPDRPHFMVTSYETASMSIRREFSALQRLWSLVILDEGHVLRNGVEKNNSPEETGRHQTYQALDRAMIQPFHPKVIVVTATPVVNHQLDAYSLLRWLGMRSLCKANWFDQSGTYLAEQHTMVGQHLVAIHQPPVPPIRHTHVDIFRGEVEAQHAVRAYIALGGAGRGLLDAIRRHACHPSAENKERERMARLTFFKHTTRCRRGEQFYPFFETTIEGESPVLEHAYTTAASDREDRVLEDGMDEEERPEEVAEEGTRPVAWQYDSTLLPPLSACAKMAQAVEYCRALQTNSDPKALIIGYYVAPLRILCGYLKTHIPGLLVFEHYGGRARANEVALDAFRSATGPAVMVASRGSFAVGKDIPWVRRMLKMDKEWSAALEEQASGRICRPLAQSIHEWEVLQTRFKDVLPPPPMAFDHGDLASYDPNPPPPDVFSFEAWMGRMQAAKKALASDVFAEGGTALEADALPTGVSTALCSRSADLAGPLSVLITMLERSALVPSRAPRVTKPVSRAARPAPPHESPQNVRPLKRQRALQHRSSISEDSSRASEPATPPRPVSMAMITPARVPLSTPPPPPRPSTPPRRTPRASVYALLIQRHRDRGTHASQHTSATSALARRRRKALLPRPYSEN